MKIEILDTTLRDGAQGVGVEFSPDDRRRVILALDRLGVSYIEAGMIASEQDAAFFESLRDLDCSFRILYIEAPVSAIVRRYKETRRTHPLSKDGTPLQDAVQKEKQLLARVRERADFIVNSSTLTLGQLQSKLFDLISPAGTKRSLEVTVEAFGFKHGLPLDADLVFDVRFLPNPYYLEELRSLSGLDRPVAQYVFDSIEARTFMEKVEDLLRFLVPLYIEEGKLSLTIGVGCTGGRHRSVAIAAALTEYLKASGVSAANFNRDIDK